jgi:hypothetical protein
MDATLKQLPAGVVLNALSSEVFEVLSRYTVFPWPVMAAQCKRVHVDARNLSKDDLVKALPYLAIGVGRFTDPMKAAATEHELHALLKRGGSSAP